MTHKPMIILNIAKDCRRSTKQGRLYFRNDEINIGFALFYIDVDFALSQRDIGFALSSRDIGFALSF